MENQLISRFKDRSLHDERVNFTQKRVFSLQSYTLIQRGPSFPATMDVAMERKTGEYRVLSFQDGSVNTRSPAGSLTGQCVERRGGHAPTKPRGGIRRNRSHDRLHARTQVIELKLIPATDRTIYIGDLAKQVTQYVLEPQLNSVTMFFGKLLGKLPRTFHYHFWLLTDDVPAFGGFEGPLYLNGPTWCIEQTTPPKLWPSQTASATSGPR